MKGNLKINPHNHYRALEERLARMIGSLPDQARKVMANFPCEHYLFFRRSQNGEWGELCIAREPPSGFELADPRPCHHIAYHAIPQFYRDCIRRLPIMGQKP